MKRNKNTAKIHISNDLLDDAFEQNKRTRHLSKNTRLDTLNISTSANTPCEAPTIICEGVPPTRCSLPNFRPREPNPNTELIEKNYTPSTNNQINLLTKEKKRRSSVIRWKQKKTNHSPSSEPGPSNTSIVGRGLLQLIPLTPGPLPVMKDCPHCGAAKFYSETKNFCCLEGRVVLVNNQLPGILKDLLTSTSDEAKKFRTYIRTYNNLFAFTSLGVKSDTNLSKRNNGIYTFKVQGQVYHFINDLLPDNNNSKNLQLYFHDTENEIQNCLASCDRLSEQAIELCMQALQENPYACFFRTLKDVPHLHNHKIVLKTLHSQDQRVYNKPDISQVAAIWVAGHENGDCGHRDIEVKTHCNQSRKIGYYYGCYDPLQYPLMFPFGELGWHQGILKKGHKEKRKRGRPTQSSTYLISPQNAANVEDLLLNEQDVMAQTDEDSKFISVREYYAYKLQIRKTDASCLLHFGRLLQQYVVDNYVKLETQRLDFFRSQQQEIRKEFLQGVVDAVADGETEGSKVGQRIVLLFTFIVGPRNMRRKYIDAMTLVQKYGKPDIFLTMTSNPNWPEVKAHLMRQQEAHNRPNLIARVFHAKLEQLKEELFKKNIFGEVAAYTYVIEFQKRGLPHAHFLLILKPQSKMYRPEEYDEIVSAEIPDEKDR